MKKILLVLCVTLMLAFMLVSCSKDHTLIFNANNGASYDKISFDVEDYGDSLLPTPEKKGYSFAGWYLDEELSLKFDIAMVTEDMKKIPLYAKYTINTYKVNVVDGDEIREYSFVYGDPISLVTPTDPVNTFGGYFLDKDCTVPFTSTVMEDRNITLYVKWTGPEVKISYVTNSESKLDSQVVLYKNISSHSYPIPKKEGHTFEGWYMDAGLKTEFSYESITPKTQSITLYAKYSVNSYYITYHSKDGDTRLAYKYGTEIKLPEPTLKNHRFIGYYTSEAYDEMFTVGVMPAKDLDVYFMWEEAAVDISFVTGTEEKIENKTVPFKDITEFDYPVPQKQGFTFAGWYTDAEFNTLFDVNSVSVETEAVTLYAKYVLNAYKLTVVNGEIVTEYIYDFGEEIKLNVPARQYYDFCGFFKDMECSEPFVETRMPAKNVRVYVLWEYSELDITYDTGTEDITLDPVSVRLMDLAEYKLPTPERKGHTFVEWCTDKELTTKFDPSAVKESGKITLYASYTVNEYKLTIDQGDVKIKQNIPYGEKLVLDTPVRENYVFAGFYTNSGLTEVFDLETMPDENVKVFVKWKEAEVTFIYNNNTDYPMASNTVAVIRVDKLVHPLPAKPYHEFVGWYVDADLKTPYDPSYVTDKMQTVNLYAKYKEQSSDSYVVTVKVSLPGAVTLTGNTEQTIKKASEFEKVTIKENIGYKFLYYQIRGGKYYDKEITLPYLTSDTEITVVCVLATNELPIININAGKIESKYDYTDMTFTLTNTDTEYHDLTGGIRLRGNSTMHHAKKPYRIKFDEKVSLFGLEEAKSWVLLADYLDPSTLHNYTAFKLAELTDSMGFNATGTKVNLYMNGEFQGIYTLCEQIQENEGRIDIEYKITEDMTDLKDFNFFICMDSYAPADPDAVYGETYFSIGEFELWFELKYPEKADFASEAQFRKFMDDLTAYVYKMLVAARDGNVEYLKKECNMNSLVDYLIIDQIMGERDHKAKSFNMYFTTTSDNPDINNKLTFGPIWDYDWALYTPYTDLPNDYYEIGDEYAFSNVYFKGVANSEELMEIVKERYNEIFAPGLEELIVHLKEVEDGMKESLSLNHQRWYPYYTGMTDKNVKFLNDYLAHRLEFLNEKWKIK
ncbi:MAG: InlB B-repeat-containing protein [Clostridia bacterium]|nr:InlB B-repeat-containing protein [Clostridia bacterium]